MPLLPSLQDGQNSKATIDFALYVNFSPGNKFQLKNTNNEKDNPLYRLGFIKWSILPQLPLFRMREEIYF